MLKRIAGLLAVLISMAMPMVASPASAEVFYPWCALYKDGGGGATNCGFVTVAQCRAAISGAGGMCYENPADPRPGDRPVKIRKTHRKQH
ncbi:MAG: DUF3551 domain-containing protein [Rhizobiales bacterium]|nr:DUF3551 domain-containing protein [Hyphomicrobiales bacterium]